MLDKGGSQVIHDIDVFTFDKKKTTFTFTWSTLFNNDLHLYNKLGSKKSFTVLDIQTKCYEILGYMTFSDHFEYNFALSYFI